MSSKKFPRQGDADRHHATREDAARRHRQEDRDRYQARKLKMQLRAQIWGDN